MRKDARALREAREAVLTAPDRQSAIMAYRYWYALKNGTLYIEEDLPEKPFDLEIPTGPGWMAEMEQNYEY